MGVDGRYLALPLAAYPALDTFAKANAAWIEAAVTLGEQALRAALDRAGLAPRELDHLFFVTVTGIATPSIDALLSNRLGLRSDLKRTPIFGLGCVAGAAALARASDYLRAYPDHTAAVLSVELCSLTLQRGDLSLSNIIASGLFGDGAAAVILQGAERAARPCGASEASERWGRAAGPRVRATRSVFYPHTERVMGWDLVADGGLQGTGSCHPEVPALAKAHIGADVDDFLGSLGVEALGYPALDRAYRRGRRSCRLSRSALGAASRAHWIARGSRSAVSGISRRRRCSSCSADLLESQGAGAPRSGERGLLLAMGPGFCAELVLLEW